MSSNNNDEEDDIPMYLMPVAAILGMHTVFGVLRTAYWIYNSRRTSKQQQMPSGRRTTTTTDEQQTTTQQEWMLLIGSWLITGLLYSFVVAKIERAYLQIEYENFDPYDILGISETTNSTIIKRAYRELAKIHHPDKGGNTDGKFFVKLTQAYQTLTNEHSMRNYQQYGHPDGPLSTPTFQMALPHWLLFPQGKVAATMVLLYFFMLVGLVIYVVRILSSPSSSEDEKKKDAASSLSLMDKTNSVSKDDLEYLANHLRPDSSQLDILLTILTCPENLEWSLLDLDRVEEVRQKRQQRDREDLKKGGNTDTVSTDFDKLFDEGGWDEDDDDNENDNNEELTAAQKAKQADEERRKDLERLKQATGQAKVLLEGFDDGVLGQKWVESTLESKHVWPPELKGTFLDGRSFTYQNRVVQAMDHPGLERLLCMTWGRLHSNMLNSHPELLEAGSKNRIDQTYFKASMEFRQRVGMLLEASLRVSMALRNQKLVSKIVETVAMFKIGVDQHNKNNTSWFNTIMTRQYGTLPRLKVVSSSIGTPDEKETATDEAAVVVLEVERSHAENFTKQKIEMFKRQGIPPQVGLQTYREGWWMMLRMQRLDGDTPNITLDRESVPMKNLNVSDETLQIFNDEDPAYKILTAWPMMIANVAQKGGKVKVQFKTPSVAGKYRYFLGIKSQDFLGADQELEFDLTVVDASTVQRTKKVDEGEEESATKETTADEAEPKKEK